MRRNPLEPLATVSSMLLGLFFVVVALGLGAAAIGSGSVYGFGHTTIAVDVPSSAGSIDHVPSAWTPAAGVLADSTGVRLFDPDPGLSQRWWFTLTLLPEQLVVVVALALTYRLLRGAERKGIYTTATADRLRGLGWLLLAGSIASTLLEAFATNRLLATMVTNVVGIIQPGQWDVPVALIVTGAGVLSFARVMRIGVAMRDELAATV